MSKCILVVVLTLLCLGCNVEKTEEVVAPPLLLLDSTILENPEALDNLVGSVVQIDNVQIICHRKWVQDVIWNDDLTTHHRSEYYNLY